MLIPCCIIVVLSSNHKRVMYSNSVFCCVSPSCVQTLLRWTDAGMAWQGNLISGVISLVNASLSLSDEGLDLHESTHTHTRIAEGRDLTWAEGIERDVFANMIDFALGARGQKTSESRADSVQFSSVRVQQEPSTVQFKKQFFDMNKLISLHFKKVFFLDKQNLYLQIYISVIHY